MENSPKFLRQKPPARSPRRLKPMGKADVGEKEGKDGRHRTFRDCPCPGFGAAGVQR
jgi:hypothetical protein